MSHQHPRRVALFSHDSQGLGHTRRNIEIAAALGRDGRTTQTLLVSGAPGAADLAIPRTARLVQIPAVRKDADGSYLALDHHTSLAATLAERGRRTAAAIRDFAPDLVIVDKHARGLRGELDEMLEDTARHRARGHGPAMVLGVRDILDDPETARREWDRDDTSTTVLAHYDQLWVYGDRTVHDPVEAYGWEPAIADRVRFTGYLSRGRGAGMPGPGSVSVPSQPFVLGLLGGGQDGADLALAFAATAAPAGYLKVLVTGPYLPTATLRSLQHLAQGRGDLLVLPFVASTLPLVRHARAVVTMGGYNTVCEVLATGAPVLVVPRIHPRLEQAIRAEQLAGTTHLAWLHPNLATPTNLCDWLVSAVRRRARPHAIDLDGLDRLPALADALVTAIEEASRAHA